MLGNIPGDLRKSTQLARPVPQCSNHHVGPKSRSVLAYPPAFLLVAAFRNCLLECMFWLAILHVFRRVETREMAAYNFIGLVAFDARCPLIPSGNISGGIEHKNGIVLDAV